MEKQEYGRYITDAISALNEELVGSNKKELITRIYQYIEQTHDLKITDEKRTSFYNTIYYFLRKMNIFKADEVNHRFDSMTSKQGFLDSLKKDLTDYPEKYKNIFTNQLPIKDDAEICVVDSKKSPAHDILYTILYFRDIRKFIGLKKIKRYSKKPLNTKLYAVFENIYKLNLAFAEYANLLTEQDKNLFYTHAVNYYHFLSEFDCVNKSNFNFEMMKHLVIYNRFVQSRDIKKLTEYNTRYFDSFSFVNVVYSGMLNAMKIEDLNIDYHNIHHLISAATYFLFSKYSKKMKHNYVSKLTEFFASDVYFSSVKYIVNYYNMFMNEVRGLFDETYYNYNVIIKEFDIILRYMLYNKFKNIVSANIKRYIGIASCARENMFVDVDIVDDNILYNNFLYSTEDPCENIAEKRFGNLYKEFFSKNNVDNKDDVTNVAVEMFRTSGKISIERYDRSSIRYGKKLYKLMREQLT
jgi:hypothetical protein